MYSNAFVCLMGIGTVFFGLTCLIALCTLMSRIVRGARRRKAPPPLPAAPPPPPPGGALSLELVAALSAAIAEDLGTDVSALRIRSIRKL